MMAGVRGICWASARSSFGPSGAAGLLVSESVNWLGTTVTVPAIDRSRSAATEMSTESVPAFRSASQTASVTL